MPQILVVEDEAPLRENICELLELEGFDVIEAEDGRVGLDCAREHIPDMIVCDIMMPELDGYEVLLQLREQPSTASIPFIFLTAKSDRNFMRHGMELGADDYLTKPFTSAELLAAINSRLERHAATSTLVDQELAQAKRSLIRMVSHELRTPLVSLHMVSDIFGRQLEQLSTKQVHELLDTLERGTQRLDRLVEQIVLIVQFETNTLSRQSIAEYGVPVRLPDLMIAAVDLARRFAYRQPDVSVRVEQRDTDTAVQSDIRALRHGLAELITNALSFSPEGSEVLVSQWEADDQVWITIVDHGPGISPEELETALKDFNQINRDSQEQQGIGLGLPLARRIIEIHRGTFDIRSVVGKGTQITISLPAVQALDHDT